MEVMRGYLCLNCRKRSLVWFVVERSSVPSLLRTVPARRDHGRLGRRSSQKCNGDTNVRERWRDAIAKNI